MEDQTLEELASIDIRVAMDSVNLVNELVSAGVHTEEIDSRVQANYKHLEIVLQRTHVINNSSADLTPLNSAITTGKAFAPIAE